MGVVRFIFRHLSPRVKNSQYPLNTKPYCILRIEKNIPVSPQNLPTNIQSLYRLSYAGSSHKTEFLRLEARAVQ